MEETVLDMTHLSKHFASSPHHPSPSLPYSTYTYSSSPSSPSPFYSLSFELFNDTTCKDFMMSNGIENTENDRKQYKMIHHITRSINPAFSKRNLN
jgi:hypothetical protein